MKKPKSVGIQKQEDIMKDYKKVTTYYEQNNKQSFRDLEKMLNISRDRISWNINRYQILKALNKLENKSYFLIVEELPIFLFKGLTSLRTKKEKDIQKFFITFAENLKSVKSQQYRKLISLCKYYWSGQIKDYSDFEKKMASIKVKKEKEKANLIKVASVSIAELIDIQEKLRAENEKLKICLKLYGIDPNNCDLLQKKINFEE